MSTFECSLSGKENKSVLIPKGKVLNLTSICLTLKRKGKGTTQLLAQSGSKGEREAIATLSNGAKTTTEECKASFSSSSSPIDLSVFGEGSITITGSFTSEGKRKDASSEEAKATKKRKTSDEDTDAVVPVIKEAKHGLHRALDISKAWNAKPQNDEGVAVTKPKPVYKEKDLKCIDYVIGNGPYPNPGAPVKINYAGLLLDGTVFDSRLKRKEPLVFRKGVHQVVRGLDLGMEGMKIGGSREITVPPELG